MTGQLGSQDRHEPTHVGGDAEAAARDITHHDEGRFVGVHDVVEVAADVCAEADGHVPGRDGEVGKLGDDREQRPMQFEGSGTSPFVLEGSLDHEPDPNGDLPESPEESY